jgi:hypothetical protein
MWNMIYLSVFIRNEGIGTFLCLRITACSSIVKAKASIYPQGLGGSEKKPNYIILQGGELTCFHFFKSSC